MGAVTLRLPSEILSTLADVDVGSERSATSLAAVAGLDTGVATLEPAQFWRRLPFIAEVMREWAFRNADTATMTLTLATSERQRQLDLPPNVSVRTITDAISEIIPR
jgi:hypothetical protein